MKITAGVSKGRKIALSRKAKGIRPTSAKARESIFNIIGAYVREATFLDLFAGAGIVGMEALSRGASTATFVEKNRFHAEQIKTTLQTAGLENKAVVYCQDVEHFIKTVQRRRENFDILFADPPYHDYDMEALFLLFSDRGVPITKDGFFIIEHFHKKTTPERIGNIALFKRYRYGDTILAVYRNRSDE
jgi:16S rRNA (guanine(966)-N(2))-methyltransferase RsmD